MIVSGDSVATYGLSILLFHHECCVYCSKLLDYGLTEQEMALVADLQVETVEEAKKIVPSLEVRFPLVFIYPTIYR